MCPGSREITSSKTLLTYQDTSDSIFKNNLGVNKLPGIKMQGESSAIQQNDLVKSKQSDKNYVSNITKLTQTVGISLADQKTTLPKPHSPKTLLSNQTHAKSVVEKKTNIVDHEQTHKQDIKELEVCASDSEKTAIVETKTNKVKTAFKRLFNVFKVP